MNYNKKKEIVWGATLLIKIILQAIPDPYIKTLLTSITDKSKDKVIEFISDLPQISDVVCEENESIVSAVKDILMEFNINDETTINFFQKPMQLADQIFNAYEDTHRSHGYNEKEIACIKKWLSKYIHILRLWSTKNTECLKRHLENIDGKMEILEKDINKLKQNDKWYASEIKKLFIEIQAIKKKYINHIVLEEEKHRLNDTFYNYFVADSTYSIKDFFLVDNYTKIELSEDNNRIEQQEQLLNEYESEFGLEQIEELIDEQKIVLVTGLYGTGKTSLLKKLYLELEEKNKTTYFFSTNSINKYIDSIIINEDKDVNLHTIEHIAFENLKIEFESYSIEQSPTYIFIDELDEFNIELDGNESYLSIFIKWLCDFQLKHPVFRFILASRKYAQVGDVTSVCVADRLFEEYYCRNEGKSMMFILTRNFSKKARNEFIEAFTQKNKKETTYQEIKKDYGKISGALLNPIFLFAFLRRFVKESQEIKGKGYYYYYSSFIKDTVSGHYGLGQNANYTTSCSSNNEREYCEILREIAFNIIKNNEKIINNEIYKESLEDEQPVLADVLTSRKFEIQLSQLNDLMPHRDYDKANLINCYFFNMDRRRIYFTDTNILFALAAEYIFYSMDSLWTEKYEFNLKDIESIAHVRLYPQLIDYIIYLTNINQKNNPNIIAYLNNFVMDNSIQSHHINLSDKNIGAVERIILLYILFIKTYNSSYKIHPHIFKEIFYYLNAYKTNKKNTGCTDRIYTIERYFMNISLLDVEFKRINLKDFNFQGSNIGGQCHFTQCKFNSNNFNNVKMSGTNFRLCELTNIKTFNIAEHTKKELAQVNFDMCYIRNVVIAAANLVFKNCVVEDMTINLKEESYVEFANCTISNLKIYNKNHHRKWPKFDKCVFKNMPQIDPFSQKEILEKYQIDM